MNDILGTKVSIENPWTGGSWVKVFLHTKIENDSTIGPHNQANTAGQTNFKIAVINIFCDLYFMF